MIAKHFTSILIVVLIIAVGFAISQQHSLKIYTNTFSENKCKSLVESPTVDFEKDHAHLGTPTRSFAKRVLSQGNQDYILAKIFDKIGLHNTPPYCVEFGHNSEDWQSTNTGNLVLRGWDHLLMDGDNENDDMNLKRHFLTSDNIASLFRTYKVPQRPEYVSIDVDSTDLWLFRALLNSEFRPMVVSVEYNKNFPIAYAITHPDRDLGGWQNDSLYGASLKALYLVAKEHGYNLMAIEDGLDLFFVDSDLVNNFDKIPDLDHWAAYAGVAFNPRVRNANDERLSMLIDYEMYCKTKNEGQSVANKELVSKFLV